MSELKQSEFPLVDAILVTPVESVNGTIAVCTNATMAPGQVYGEVEPELSNKVAVYGSLKVNRDGAERLIVNSLVHPTLQDVVLFGTETSSFRPSSNLLQALQHGVVADDANRIIHGHNKNAQYPNLKLEHIDAFRNQVRVLPIFMSETNGTSEIVQNYLDWLEDRTDQATIELLRDLNSRPNKIYFDSLNRLIRHLGGEATREKAKLQLDPADFQHLQPPLREIKVQSEIPTVPFCVSRAEEQVEVTVKVGDESVTIRESDTFLLGYSIMKRIGEKKDLLTPLEQLTLGAEVARVSTQMHTESITTAPFCVPEKGIIARELSHSESIVHTVIDSDYYYMVSIKNGDTISVMCMANDQCEQVYEVRADNAVDLLAQIADDNRFKDYDMDFLHRYDVGMQIGRADIAVRNGYEFVQDFDSIFKVNTENFPLIISEADNFLTMHHDVLRDIYTRGLTAEHGDRQKGLTRSAAALAIFRSAGTALTTMPRVYKQGDQTTEQMRSEYEAQLLRFDHDGSYSYGERTRSYFGFDQLEQASVSLRTNPESAFIIQRFDPTHDMVYGVNLETGQPYSSEDPCLTHDIYFILDGKLQSFHIARAHNTVNAYPENVFGLHDAYDKRVSADLGIPLGDMFMLSNRANILLLTEEQKARRIISMPVKPLDDVVDRKAGPYKLGETIKQPELLGGVIYSSEAIIPVNTRPKNVLLDQIENLNGVNTLERAISYLRRKGRDHNNPVLSTYLPDFKNVDAAQEGHLAFFQANMMGSKLCATAVFVNRSKHSEAEDKYLVNYLATKYSKELGIEVGNLVCFNIGSKP